MNNTALRLTLPTKAETALTERVFSTMTTAEWIEYMDSRTKISR